MRIAAIIITLILLGCTSKPLYPEPTTRGNEIIVDTLALKNAIPQFFSYIRDGKRYDFFILSLNQDIASYIDACFKCGPKRKGFETIGARLKCRACGESFPLSRLNGIGSCYPIILEGELRGTQYFIRTDTLIRKTQNPL